MRLSKINKDILKLCNQLINLEISCSNFVTCYDAIAITDGYYNVADPFFKKYDNFHNDIALYVSNEEWRKEYSLYYGDKELLQKAKKFKDSIM